MISGKGLYIWRADEVLRRMDMPAADAAQTAKDAGVEHVIIKIADGTSPFPIPEKDPGGHKERATQELVDALKAQGIAVWGFSFVYGQRALPEDQARIFADRAKHFGLTGLVINAENIGNNKWSTTEGEKRAGTLARILRQEMGGNVVLALSTYRFPQFHSEFPFEAFMEECDIAMPQVYWVMLGGKEGDAVANLTQSYDEYRARFPRKLIIPTGAAYGEGQADGSYWSASPRQIERFLAQAKAMALPAVNFWSWEHAYNDPGNDRAGGTVLWDTLAAFRYDPASPGDSGMSFVGEDIALRINVGEMGYFDGLHTQFPKAGFTPFARDGQSMKFAQSVGNTPSSVWAIWMPDITVSGKYNISVWVPGIHATSRRARYHIHGVVGENQPISVDVNQQRFSDVWVSLGIFDLDANNPSSGQINLTNFTGEEGREVGFAAVRWQKVVEHTPDVFLADGFDAPVGTAAERRSDQVWPGMWIDANPYNTLYMLRGSQALHTGADLNLNLPGHFDADAHAPVVAVASGVVTFAGFRELWGNLVVIRHDPLTPGGAHVYSRSAHLERIDVQSGERVQRGQPLGRIGQGDPQNPLPFHLHFDISPTEAMFTNPGDWPGLDQGRINRDYVDPLAFIRQHRPQ